MGSEMCIRDRCRLFDMHLAHARTALNFVCCAAYDCSHLYLFLVLILLYYWFLAFILTLRVLRFCNLVSSHVATNYNKHAVTVATNGYSSGCEVQNSWNKI